MLSLQLSGDERAHIHKTTSLVPSLVSVLRCGLPPIKSSITLLCTKNSCMTNSVTVGSIVDFNQVELGKEGGGIVANAR